VHVT